MMMVIQMMKMRIRRKREIKSRLPVIQVPSYTFQPLYVSDLHPLEAFLFPLQPSISVCNIIHQKHTKKHVLASIIHDTEQRNEKDEVLHLNDNILLKKGTLFFYWAMHEIS